jgi:hypothetical protein
MAKGARSEKQGATRYASPKSGLELSFLGQKRAFKRR